MNKQQISKFLDSPTFYALGSIAALLSWMLGWIGYEYVIVCVGAAILGYVLHWRKQTPAEALNLKIQAAACVAMTMTFGYAQAEMPIASALGWHPRVTWA